MRNLRQDPDAVSCFSLCVLPGSVPEPLYDQQGIVYQLMALPALRIDNRPDPAVVMFKAGVVQSFLLNLTKRFQTSSSSHDEVL